MTSIIRFVLVAVAVAGCASSNAESGGAAKPSSGAERERLFQFSGGDTLQQRASFDLGCPPNQMEAMVLQRVGMFAVASSVGVRGCGRQATYMRSVGTSGTWVLNGPVMVMTPSQPPPPSPPQQQ